jgi:hypothetical protein
MNGKAFGQIGLSSTSVYTQKKPIESTKVHFSTFARLVQMKCW